MSQKTCNVCGYAWKPRKENPVACPRCKSYNYNGITPRATNDQGVSQPTNPPIKVEGGDQR